MTWDAGVPSLGGLAAALVEAGASAGEVALETVALDAAGASLVVEGGVGAGRFKSQKEITAAISTAKPAEAPQAAQGRGL